MASHEEESSFNNPDNFCDRMRYYWLNHKKHMLIFLISIIVGVSVGVGLNFGFNLSGGNLVVHRTFKQNQAMQYGRVLSYCMDIKSNTTHPTTDNATEQCNIEKSMITFYVANVTENGFSIICQINDHQSFAVTNAMLNTSNLSSLSYNDFPNNTYIPIEHMFYLQLNSDAEFVSISSDKNCTDANLGIAKNLIQQFTPKLNKQLFQSKTGSSSTYFGRALGEVTNPEPASEEHPQGYIQPKRTIENEDKNSITIQKSYSDKDFVPGSGFDSSRSSMTFSEQALLDKQQGTLNKSVLSQTYQYKKSPENDVLNMDFNARTASNLALLSQKYFDKDASKDLFGETIQFPSNPRALAQLKTDTKLFDINHSAKMARESINRFADNIESESRKLGVLDEHEKRILENAPSAEKLGETYLIILANKPSILFEYGFKFFVEVNLYKDYYKNFAALDDATGLDLYKSYINTAYEVKMSILQGDTSIRDVSLVTGAIKLNTTLLDMLSNIESFEKEVFKYLKGFDDKIKAFAKRASDYLSDLKYNKKILFTYSYSLVIVSIKFEVNVFFDIDLQLNTNIMQLYDATTSGLKQYYDEMRSKFTNSFTSWVPQTIDLTKIKVDPAIISAFQNFICEKTTKFYDWWWRDIYRCKNTDGSQSDYKPDEYNSKLNSLNSAVANYKNLFADAKTKFLNGVKAFREKFKEVAVKLGSFFKLNLTAGFQFTGSLKLSAFVKLETSVINIGLMVNGTLVGFETGLGISFDIYNIATDIRNIGSYIRINFNFRIFAFKMGFYLFFEAMDCDFFEKYSSLLSVAGFTRLLSTSEKWHLIDAIKNNDEIKGLEHIQTGLMRENKGRQLGISFYSVGMTIWNFFQKIKNNAKLSCGVLPGDKQMFTEPFWEAENNFLEWSYELPPITIKDIFGKIVNALKK